MSTRRSLINVSKVSPRMFSLRHFLSSRSKFRLICAFKDFIFWRIRANSLEASSLTIPRRSSTLLILLISSLVNIQSLKISLISWYLPGFNSKNWRISLINTDVFTILKKLSAGNTASVIPSNWISSVSSSKSNAGKIIFKRFRETIS